MSAFNDSDEDDEITMRKKKIRLERGNEKKRNALFPSHPQRSDRDEDAIECLVKTLKMLCSGKSINVRKGDDPTLYVSCGNAEIIRINVGDTVGPAPEFERNRNEWNNCAYTYHITQRIRDYVESTMLNGKANSCGQIMSELLMSGPQFSLQMIIYLYIPKERPESRDIVSMSDSDFKRHIIEKGICKSAFLYNGGVDRIKKLLLTLVDVNLLQADDEGEDWSVTITIDKWMKNWDSELRGFVPLFKRSK